MAYNIRKIEATPFLLPPLDFTPSYGLSCLSTSLLIDRNCTGYIVQVLEY